MTTTETDADLADLEDQAGDQIVLAKNGWVRLQMGDRLVRLRPPFFGEYKAARLRLESIQQEIGDLAEEVADTAQAIADRDEALSKDESMDERARQKARRALQRESIAAGRALTEAQEPLWLAWWATTIEVLCVDKPLPDTDPDMLPPYMAAAVSALRVLTHWRAGPLARG